MTNVLCREIRQVPTGYIVQARWPIGPEPSGYGEVLCRTFDEVVAVLRRCLIGGLTEAPAERPEE